MWPNQIKEAPLLTVAHLLTLNINQKEFQKGVKLRVSKMKDLKFVLSNGSLHNVQDVFNTLVVEFRPQLTTGVFLVLKHAY